MSRRFVRFVSQRIVKRVRRRRPRRLFMEPLEIRTLLTADLFSSGHEAAAEVNEGFEEIEPQARSGRIVINDGDGVSTAIGLGNGHPSVVELSIAGGTCTGTLIDPTHVLTAQHCTFGALPAAMSVFFHHLNNDGFPDAIVGVAAKAEIDATNVLLDGTDVAVLTLAGPAPVGVPAIPISTVSPTGVPATTVGFGLNGVGSVGHLGTRDFRRWGGNNHIDAFGAAFGPGGVPIAGSANIFNTDFDDGSAGANTLAPGLPSSAMPITFEATTAPGDSGGPLLVGGAIAGVLSGGSTVTSVFGDISWWTGTVLHSAFILGAAPGATFSAPAAPDVCDVDVDGGNLDIDCGDLDNAIKIEQGATADEFIIRSATSLLDDGSGPVTSLTIDGVDGDLNIDLDDGNDVVVLDGTAVPEDLNIDGNDGINTVRLVGATVDGDVKIDNEDGFDAFDLDDSAIEGDLDISNGNGGSDTDLNPYTGLPATIGGDVNVENGDGYDALDIQDITFDDLTVDNGDGGSLTFIGDISLVAVTVDDIALRNDDGFDVLILGDAEIEGTVEVENGNGGSYTSTGAFGGTTNIDGDLKIENAEGYDTVFLDRTVIEGDLQIQNSDGGSYVDLGFFASVDIGGDLEVYSDDGTDFVRIGDTRVGGKTKINTGDDDDLITILGSTFDDDVDIDGGDGLDTFTDGGGNTFLGDLDLDDIETVI